MTKARKTRVLIVDYMPLARRALVEGLAGSDVVDVTAAAPTPGTALGKLEASQPDVILLDLEDPAGEETDVLARLVREVQIPIVLLTSMNEGARRGLVAALGVDPEMVLEKPVSSLVSGIFDLVPALEARLKKAHVNDLLRWRGKRRAVQAPPVIPKTPVQRIIAVGASTGGTEVLAELLAELPREMPGIVIVQHMPPGFTRKFAERLDQLSLMDVKEAEDGDSVRPGGVLVAAGGRQLRVVRQGEGYAVRVQERTRVSGHCPSVDVLLSSVATSAGPRGIGVVLTGMGKDGAEGLLKMRQAGARTFAQDEQSSIVYGMPAEANRLGAAEKVVSARDLPRHLAMAACS